MRAFRFEANYAFVYRAAGKGEELWRTWHGGMSAVRRAGKAVAGYDQGPSFNP